MVFAGLIIFGGVKRIARVVEKIVPIMAVGYLLLAAFVIIKNINMIPSVISLIFRSAFGFEEFLGGGIGTTIMMGIKRGLFSNEAGMTGIQLTQTALSKTVGSGTNFFAIAILFFAFSSILSNYVYRETNIKFGSLNNTFVKI